MVTRMLPALALLLLLVACGGAEEPSAAPSPTPATAATPSPTATATPAPTAPTAEPAATPTGGPAATPAPAPPAEGAPEPGQGPEAAGPPDTEPVEGGDFPAGGGDTAYLTDVRIGAHDGFDRVVLEFSGSAPPSHRVGYVDPPVLDDGSGEPIAIAGDAFLELRMTPASGVDLSGAAMEPTYDGPTRLSGRGTGVVTEVVRIGDFEATLAWVVGLEREAPFTATWLRDPLRLVVDVTTS